MRARVRLLITAVFSFTLAAGISAQAKLDHAKPPTYPLAARAAGIEGTVVLKCLITKDGKVQDIRVISGPSALQQAAIDAVTNWTYQPYKHFGRPVEVDTTVNVNFSMGNREEKLAAQAKAQAELAKSTQPAPTQEPLATTAPKQ